MRFLGCFGVFLMMTGGGMFALCALAILQDMLASQGDGLWVFPAALLGVFSLAVAFAGRACVRSVHALPKLDDS